MVDSSIKIACRSTEIAECLLTAIANVAPVCGALVNLALEATKALGHGLYRIASLRKNTLR